MKPEQKPVKPEPKKNPAAQLREMADDKTKNIPEFVREQMRENATKKEYEAYEKTKRYAKGGMVRGYGAAVRGRGRGKVC